MKNLFSLVFIVLSMTMFGVTQSYAQTAATQKAKRLGLNQASPNQMLTQQLGTELIAKSSRLVVLSYDFTASPAASGSTITLKDKYTGQTGKVPNCHIVAGSANSAAYISTPTEVVTSGPATLQIDGGAFDIAAFDIDSNASVLGAGYALALTLNQGVVGCAGDTTVTVDVLDGGITSGKMEITLEAFPYNQTK